MPLHFTGFTCSIDTQRQNIYFCANLTVQIERTKAEGLKKTFQSMT